MIDRLTMRHKARFIIIAFILLMPLQHAAASDAMLPWLNFGSNFLWDSNSHTLSDGGLAYVNSVTYLDGSTVPPPFFPPSDSVLWNPVSFSLSFDSDNSNDFLMIQQGGATWFSAGLEIIDTGLDPLSSAPNPYTVLIKSDGLTVATGMGSQWADEFATVLSDASYPAQLNFAWLGQSFETDTPGRYQINAGGNIAVAVVPEPLSSVLFIAGGVLIAGRRIFRSVRRK